MRKTIAWLVGLALIAFSVGNAEAIAGNKFKDLSAFTSGDDFKLIFDFEKTPSTKVTFKDDLAQIEVYGAYSVPSKKMFELNRSGIKEVMVYQYEKDILRIRIFPLTDMKKLRKDLSFTTDGKKLIVNLKKVTGAGTLPKSVKKRATAPKNRQTAKKIIKKEERAAQVSKKSRPKVSEKKGFDFITAAEAKEPADKKGFLDYSEPVAPAVPSLGEALLKVGSSLLIVLALVLFLAFIAKKYRGTIEAKLGSANEIKVISSQFIGVKKEVTIVEVAGEILVLGVTSQNINLLASYSDPDRIDQIRVKNRLPKNPKGITKKIPGMKWGVSAKSKISNKFERHISNEEARLEETRSAIAAENKNRAVSKAAQEIADKLKAMKQERRAAAATA